MMQAFSDIYTLIIIVLILFLASSLLRTILERRRGKHEQFKTKTVIKCLKCNYMEERDFQPGDYILKPEKECPKCGTMMRIHRIFEVKITPISRKQKTIQLPKS